MVTYKVIRFFFDRPGQTRTIKTRLSLEEAQKHCSEPETSSSTATSAKARRYTERHGQWFDGYTEEK